MADGEQPKPIDGADLAQEETRARIAKLHAEREQLAFQASTRRWEMFKALAGLGTVLAGLAAASAFLYSIPQGVIQFNRDREVRIEERLDSALAKVSGESRIERLTGVISLKSFLETEDADRQKRVLLAFAHLLAIEEDPSVRSAIVEVFRDLDSKLIASTAIDDAAKALVSLSRSLVENGKLNRKNIAGVSFPDLFTRDLNARSVGTSLVALLRVGASVRDLSGIYCSRCDFSRLSLDGARFDDSVLIEADFSEARLIGASFDRADLEAARFIRTDLRESRMVATDPKWVGGFSTQHAWDKLSDRLTRVGMPDFSCADLRGAEFSGQVLFGLVRSDAGLIYPANFESAKFRHARLKGADFRHVSVYGVDQNSSTPELPFTTRSGGGSGVHIDEGKSYWSFTAELGEDSRLTNMTEHYQGNLEDITFAFAGADWREAKLPQALRTLLTEAEKNTGGLNWDKESACDVTRTIL